MLLHFVIFFFLQSEVHEHDKQFILHYTTQHISVFFNTNFYKKYFKHVHIHIKKIKF